MFFALYIYIYIVNDRVQMIEIASRSLQASLRACLGQISSTGPWHLQMKVLLLMFLVVQKPLPMVGVPIKTKFIGICKYIINMRIARYGDCIVCLIIFHVLPDQSPLCWNSQDLTTVSGDLLQPCFQLQNLESNERLWRRIYNNYINCSELKCVFEGRDWQESSARLELVVLFFLLQCNSD